VSSDVAFAIRLELATPIIPGRRFMLDALLSGLLFERLGDAARAVAEIPLSRHGQTWCGSQALLYRIRTSQRFSEIRTITKGYARIFVSNQAAFCARRYYQRPPRTPLSIGRILTLRPTNKMCASPRGPAGGSLRSGARRLHDGPAAGEGPCAGQYPPDRAWRQVSQRRDHEGPLPEPDEHDALVRGGRGVVLRAGRP